MSNMFSIKKKNYSREQKNFLKHSSENYAYKIYLLLPVMQIKQFFIFKILG